jgi:hypothetical protein
MELDQLSLDGATPSVSTDLLDYPSGSTATITASGFIVGSIIEFQLSHVLDAGADCAYDVLNHVLGDNSADGHDPWTVTEGVRTAGAGGILGNTDDNGDLDGIALNGE